MFVIAFLPHFSKIGKKKNLHFNFPSTQIPPTSGLSPS